MAISAEDFGTSFKGFLDQMSAATPAEEPVFRRRLREHFEREPNELPTLTERYRPTTMQRNGTGRGRGDADSKPTRLRLTECPETAGRFVDRRSAA